MLKVGSLELPSRYLLAPLAGYTNLSFRLAVRAWADSAWRRPTSSTPALCCKPAARRWS